MAKHKTDYDSILRSKRECKKQRSYLKRNIKLTSEDIKKVEELIKKEKENGVERSIIKYKGNYMYKINKLLYNPWLLPKERICITYEFTETSCKGKLRDKNIICIKMKRINSKNIYYIKINNELKCKCVGQFEACEKIKELIGLPEGWDDDQGSARIFS